MNEVVAVLRKRNFFKQAKKRFAIFSDTRSYAGFGGLF